MTAMLRSLPVGVIVVDENDLVVSWNPRAEEFIACVGRPTLFEGMSLDGAHSDAFRKGMSAMMKRLKDGAAFPCKRVTGGDRTFRVWYNALTAADGRYLGVAQVIEFIDAEGDES